AHGYGLTNRPFAPPAPHRGCPGVWGFSVQPSHSRFDQRIGLVAALSPRRAAQSHEPPLSSADRANSSRHLVCEKAVLRAQAGSGRSDVLLPGQDHAREPPDSRRGAGPLGHDPPAIRGVAGEGAAHTSGRDSRTLGAPAPRVFLHAARSISSRGRNPLRGNRPDGCGHQALRRKRTIESLCQPLHRGRSSIPFASEQVAHALSGGPCDARGTRRTALRPMTPSSNLWRIERDEYDAICDYLGLSPRPVLYERLSMHLSDAAAGSPSPVGFARFLAEMPVTRFRVARIDLLTKLRFPQHPLRHALNGVIALHECDGDGYREMSYSPSGW